MISVIFFGTHQFAVKILETLTNDPEISVDLVITQPNKPSGRKQKLTPSPVKIFAEINNLPIETPISLKDYLIEKDRYDLGVTAQYGNIIPKQILDSPKHGILNIHTSLLPKYRGATPIQSALVNGDDETGVTIMKMDPGLDTGPILLQKRLSIGPEDTYTTIDTKLANIGSTALLEAIPSYIDGSLKPIEQDGSLATNCKQLSREDGQVDWSRSATEIYNQYRGLTPWPGVWTTLNNKRLKLLKINALPEKTLMAGKIGIENDTIFIGTGNGSIVVSELQLEGKKPVSSKDFILGHKNIDSAQVK